MDREQAERVTRGITYQYRNMMDESRGKFLEESSRRGQMPRRYRLIPVTVEAIQLTAESVKRAALWCRGVEVEEVDAVDSTKKFVALNIPTVSGVIRASEGHYIVKGKQGIEVLKPDEFESKYELIQ